MATPPVDKAGLLAAVAAAGSQGATDYQASQSVLTGHKTDAIRQVLSSSIAKAAPPGAGDVLSGIISQPYNTRQAQLSSNAATDSAYYGTLGNASGTYATEQNKLPAMIEANYQTELAKVRAEWEADQARRASSGGGGGGGGGSSTYAQLIKEYGGKGNLQDYIKGAAAESGDPYGAQAIAIELGIDPFVAKQRFPYGSADEQYLDAGNAAFRSALAAKQRPTLGQFRQGLASISVQLPGNQHPLRRQLVQQYKATLKKKK